MQTNHEQEQGHEQERERVAHQKALYMYHELRNKDDVRVYSVAEAEAADGDGRVMLVRDPVAKVFRVVRKRVDYGYVYNASELETLYEISWNESREPNDDDDAPQINDIPEMLLAELRERMQTNPKCVIIGPRASGKSMLAAHLARDYLPMNRLDPYLVTVSGTNVKKLYRDEKEYNRLAIIMCSEITQDALKYILKDVDFLFFLGSNPLQSSDLAQAVSEWYPELCDSMKSYNPTRDYEALVLCASRRSLFRVTAPSPTTPLPTLTRSELSAKLAQNPMCAIIGPRACGKSVLLRDLYDIADNDKKELADDLTFPDDAAFQRMCDTDDALRFAVFQYPYKEVLWKAELVFLFAPGYTKCESDIIQKFCKEHGFDDKALAWLDTFKLGTFTCLVLDVRAKEVYIFKAEL